MFNQNLIIFMKKLVILIGVIALVLLGINVLNKSNNQQFNQEAIYPVKVVDNDFGKEKTKKQFQKIKF